MPWELAESLDVTRSGRSLGTGVTADRLSLAWNWNWSAFHMLSLAWHWALSAMQTYPRHSALNAVQKLVTRPRFTSFLHSNGSKNAFDCSWMPCFAIEECIAPHRSIPPLGTFQNLHFKLIFTVTYEARSWHWAHWSAECNLDTGLALGTECFA